MTVQEPYGAPPPPPKKGLSPLAWVGIGCGVILVLCLIVFGVFTFWLKNKVQQIGENPEMAAAEFIVRANPDVEMVSKDEDAKTITVRDKKTNEEMTLSLADIKNGKIEFKTDKGTATFGKEGITVTDEKGQASTVIGGPGTSQDLPDWVPAYPGGTTAGSFVANTPEAHTGQFTVTTSDSIEKVVQHYESELKAAGFSVQQSTSTSNGSTSGATVTGTTEGDKRTVSIYLAPGDNGGAVATVTYNEKLK